MLRFKKFGLRPCRERSKNKRKFEMRSRFSVDTTTTMLEFCMYARRLAAVAVDVARCLPRSTTIL